ncbi:FCD domain-containing protein [Vibrio splendidus]
MALTGLNVKPMRKQKLSDGVADEIEKLIVNNSLKKGDTLPSERELMAAFDVGRPSVREALMKLSQKGLVEIKSGEKTRVTRPTTETLLGNISGVAIGLLSQEKEKHQFEHMRQIFEVAMVREAARVRTEDDIHRLKMILDHNKSACDDNDRFVETDIEFHLCIIDMLKNPMISSLYQSLISWLIKARNPTDYIPYHEQNYGEHVKIVDAIVEGNPNKAEQVMSDHLDAVMRIENREP